MATTAGILSALLLLPLGLGAYVWLGAVALTVWSLALLDPSGSPRRAFAAGVLGALAVAWRPEAAIVVIGSSAPYLWRSRQAPPWVLGTALGALPMVAHAALGGWPLWSNVFDRVSVNTDSIYLRCTP